MIYIKAKEGLSINFCAAAFADTPHHLRGWHYHRHTCTRSFCNHDHKIRDVHPSNNSVRYLHTFRILLVVGVVGIPCLCPDGKLGCGGSVDAQSKAPPPPIPISLFTDDTTVNTSSLSRCCCHRSTVLQCIVINTCWKAPNLLGSNCETKASFIYSSRCFTCFSSTPT
jgi:hypothetical protein